jgi:hypothetical protein
MRTKIITGFAALLVGGALISTSAFAQSGRNPNDGGLAKEGDYYAAQKSGHRSSRVPAENFKKGDYYAPETAPQPHLGKPLNDGGM